MGRPPLTPEQRQAAAARRRQRQAEKMRSLRLNPLYRTQERLRNTLSRRLARQDETRRASERERDRHYHRVARQDETRRAEERVRNTLARRLARQEEARRALERESGILVDQETPQDEREPKENTNLFQDLVAHHYMELQYSTNLIRQPRTTMPRNVARRGRPMKRTYTSDSEEDVKPDPVVLNDTNVFKDNILFECAVCFFTTQEERSFLQHVQDIHKREMGYWCKWCGKSFVNPTALVDHVKGKCQREKLYLHPCGFPKCGFVHSDPSVFSFHLKNEHKGKYLMPCALCEQPFTIPSSLIFHLQEHCPQKAKCLLQGNSDKTFQDYDQLGNSKFNNSHRNMGNKQRRVRRHSAEMDIECEGSPQSVLECAACLFRTSDPEEFTEHHNDMHKREVCCCKHCGQAFKNANLLLSHHQGHTCPKEKRFEHPCGVNDCKFVDSDPLVFVSHLKSCHTEEPLYPCAGCQKQFTIFPLLVNHMQQECSSLNKNPANKKTSLSISKPVERPARKVIRTYDNEAAEQGEVDVSDVEDLNECVDDGANSEVTPRQLIESQPTPVPGPGPEVMEIEVTPQYLTYDSDYEPEDPDDLHMIVPTTIVHKSRRGRGSRGAYNPRVRRARGRPPKTEC